MKNNGMKKKNYHGFFDAEYTCYMESDHFFDKKHSGELLSVGVIICDKNYNFVQSYYSPVRPIYNRRLTGYCKSLTGLTQAEIDAAPSYDEVFQKLVELFQEYPVRELYTWGNDAHTLFHDIEQNHKNVARKYKRVAGLLRDITKQLTRRVFGKGMSLSLSDMKYICGMEPDTVHNAKADAMDLYRVTKSCLQETYDKERAKKVEDFILKREIYHQYRRFKKTAGLKTDPGPGTQKKKKSGGKNGDGKEKNFRDISDKYIRELKTYFRDAEGNVPTEILALCDDVRILAGKQSRECPKLEKEK